MIRSTILATATLAALALPAFAAPLKPPMMQPHHTGQWYVIQSAASGQCYVADRRAGLDEAQLGVYGSQSQANTALAWSIPCANAAGGNSPPDRAKSS
jgi:hypothetical protein